MDEASRESPRISHRGYIFKDNIRIFLGDFSAKIKFCTSFQVDLREITACYKICK